MMNALRLSGGFEQDNFVRHTGLSLEVLKVPLAQAHAAGWLVTEDTIIRPTVSGLNYLNDLLQCFMPDSSGQFPGRGHE